jgi:hypothetical protein
MPRETRDVPGSSAAPRWVFATCAALVLLGAILRLRGIDKSLWLDEAWVANSLLADSVRGMLFYDRWLQTSPPLFLIAARAAVRLFGEGNWAFHLIPWAFGGLALVVFARMAQRRLASGFAVLAVALFALSPAAIYYARELKQYSAELLVGTSLLWLSFEARRRGGLRLRWAVPALSASVGLSYNAVVFLPGLLLAQLGRLDPLGERHGQARRRSVLLMVATVLVAFGALAFQVRGNSSPLLREFWFDDTTGHLAAQANSLARYAATLLSTLPGGGYLSQLPYGAEVGILAVATLCCGGILAARVALPGRRRETLTTLALCAIPMAGMLVGSLLRVYPWKGGTSLALLPCLALGLVAALEALAHAGAPQSESARPWPDGHLAVRLRGGLAALLLLAGLAVGTWRALRPVLPREDIDTAVRFLRGSTRPGDLIYVHASMAEGFRLYAHTQQWAPSGVVFGRTGWPCCARGVSRRESVADIVSQHDLATLVPPDFRGRVWAIFTGRARHWAYVGVDEPRLMRDDMARRACRLEQEFRGTEVVVLRFACLA